MVRSEAGVSARRGHGNRLKGCVVKNKYRVSGSNRSGVSLQHRTVRSGLPGALCVPFRVRFGSLWRALVCRETKRQIVNRSHMVGYINWDAAWSGSCYNLPYRGVAEHSTPWGRRANQQNQEKCQGFSKIGLIGSLNLSMMQLTPLALGRGDKDYHCWHFLLVGGPLKAY